MNAMLGLLPCIADSCVYLKPSMKLNYLSGLPPNVSGTRPRNKLTPVISPYAPAILSYPGTYGFQESSLAFAFATSTSVGACFASSSSALVSGKNGPNK